MASLARSRCLSRRRRPTQAVGLVDEQHAVGGVLDPLAGLQRGLPDVPGDRAGRGRPRPCARWLSRPRDRKMLPIRRATVVLPVPGRAEEQHVRRAAAPAPSPVLPEPDLADQGPYRVLDRLQADHRVPALRNSSAHPRYLLAPGNTRNRPRQVHAVGGLVAPRPLAAMRPTALWLSRPPPVRISRAFPNPARLVRNMPATTVAELARRARSVQRIPRLAQPRVQDLAARYPARSRRRTSMFAAGPWLRKPSFGVQELLHLGRIARHDDDQPGPVVPPRSGPEQRVDRLLAEPAHLVALSWYASSMNRTAVQALSMSAVGLRRGAAHIGGHPCRPPRPRPRAPGAAPPGPGTSRRPAGPRWSSRAPLPL